MSTLSPFDAVISVVHLVFLVSGKVVYLFLSAFLFVTLVLYFSRNYLSGEEAKYPCISPPLLNTRDANLFLFTEYTSPHHRLLPARSP